MTPQQTMFVLDPNGSDSPAENEALRALGSATLVDVLGVTAWSVSDPNLLKTLLSGREVTKDLRAHWPAFPETVTTWPLALWIAVSNMFTAGGGDHRRLRRMVSPAFTPRRILSLDATITTMVGDILDDLEGLPPGTVVDLRERLAYPLPIAVIGQLMGVPQEQRNGFRAVVDGVFDTTLTTAESAANVSSLYAALDTLIEAKRAEPCDDMTSLLVAARDEEGDGSGMSDSELRDTLLLMISAGYETTVNVIDQAVTALLTDPDQLAHVHTGRATWNDIVEETLRLTPAVRNLPLRVALTDIALPDGRTIAQGDAILASYGAANSHPAWHGSTAGQFNAARITKDHLAFGHGIHFCLGAPLARMEVATALRLLFTRFPDIALAVPPQDLKPLPSLISNGHQELPVRLRPAG